MYTYIELVNRYEKETCHLHRLAIPQPAASDHQGRGGRTPEGARTDGYLRSAPPLTGHVQGWDTSARRISRRGSTDRQERGGLGLADVRPVPRNRPLGVLPPRRRTWAQTPPPPTRRQTILFQMPRRHGVPRILTAISGAVWHLGRHCRRRATQDSRAHDRECSRQKIINRTGVPG